MKFASTSPHYFAEMPERFTVGMPDIKVIHGADFLSADTTSTIYVDEAMEPKDVVSLLCDKSLNHIIQKNKDHFHEDLWTTGQIVVTPEKYFSMGARSLIESSENSYSIEFNEKPHKVKLKEESAHFVGACGNQGLVQAADVIIEELYMNAMIDAPKEAAKRGIPAYGKPVNVLQLEKNQNRLVISCADPFGALNINKFLNRMNEVYAKGAGEVINLRGQGGAGLGCVIMFEHSMSLFLGVQKNRCTRVSCVLPIGLNNRQRANVKKSLHRLDLES